MLYNENLQKPSPIFFFKGGGGAPGAPVLDPPLALEKNVALGH